MTGADDKAARDMKRQQKLLNTINSMFKKIENAQSVIEYKIKNYTEADLERFLSDVLRYTSQLIDLNNYAYTVLGLFGELKLSNNFH